MLIMVASTRIKTNKLVQRFYSKTGGLVAISGGRDFKYVVNRNQATDPHPTGSSLKPFLAYGPAIENMKWGNKMICISR